MAAPRVFVSHSHQDNDWCREFVAALQAAGWDVWYDEKGLSGGATWVATIQRELQAREIFLLILTPEAWVSHWVQEELNLAFVTRRTVVPVLHQETPDVSGFLLGRQWIRVVGLPGAAAAQWVIAEIPAQPDPSPVQPTAPPPPATAPPVHVPVASAPQTPRAASILSPEQFPARLDHLGFTVHQGEGVAYIQPPLCAVPAGEF